MIKNSNSTQKQKIIFQVIFWCAFFLIGEVKIYAEYKNPMFSQIIPYDLTHLLFQIIGANFAYSILIKKLFYRKQYIVFAVSTIMGIYGISVLNRLFTIYIAEPFFIETPQDDVWNIITDVNYLFCFYVIPIVTASFIFVSVSFMLDLRNEKENSVQLLKEKAELELKALKTRLNPHFLFNTLNNIYSLSIINSNKTSESISRLSNMLDYILYKAEKKMVLISEEMKVIKDYIELEKLRYNERLQLIVTENIQSENQIPPLLFLSLVENAFKHGKAGNTGKIAIFISIETDAVKTVLKVENSFIPKENMNSKGLGLKIIQDQLKIIYGDQSQFKIENENGFFKVQIQIPANEN